MNRSVLCENYPACFMLEEGEAGACLLCNYKPTDGHDLINHIEKEHPIKEVECRKCRRFTRVKGELCEDCAKDAEINPVNRSEEHTSGLQSQPQSRMPSSA